MEIIIELIVWFIIEVIFWGIMFWTGSAIIKCVTLGHWKPVNSGRDKDKWKENRKETKFIAVAIIGALFGFSVGIAILPYTKL